MGAQLKSGRELEALIENLLRKAGMNFVKDPVVGHTRPDFLVTTSGGDQIVVEAKAWTPSSDRMSRAIHQAQTYKELSKADAAIVVIGAGHSRAFPGGAVVSVDEFLTNLTELSQKLAQTRGFRKPVESRASPEKKIFASMPFNRSYDDTFLVAIQPAALAVNAVAFRVDHDGHSGDLVRQIKEMIGAAQVVIADLSESRPNVCHEVGYAEALGRPVVQISSEALKSLPFNLRNNQTIGYKKGQTMKLRTKLEQSLRILL